MPEFRVNTYTIGDQRLPSIAALNDGGFIITWSSSGQYGNFSEIYAKRYNAIGIAQGSEFRVSTDTTQNQLMQQVAGLSDGGFVIVWQNDGANGNSLRIYSQIYNATGGIQGLEFGGDNYTISATDPWVTSLKDGGFVIAWDGQRDYGNLNETSLNQVYAQIYNAIGIAQGTIFSVGSYTPNYQSNPVIATTNNGDFIIAWIINDSDQQGDNSIYAQRYNITGGAIGSMFQVNTNVLIDQTMPRIAALNDGGFIITWDCTTPGSAGLDSDSGVCAKRYNMTGDVQRPELLVTSSDSEYEINYAPVAGMNDGGLL